MGLFDTFIPKEPMKCPYCGKFSIDDFQTKDLFYKMLAFRVDDKVENGDLVAKDGDYPVYTSCDWCGSWVEAEVVIIGGEFKGFIKYGRLDSQDNRDKFEAKEENDGGRFLKRKKGSGGIYISKSRIEKILARDK